MKNPLLIAIITVFSFQGKILAQSVIEAISAETCTCLENAGLDNSSSQEDIQKKMSACLMQSAPKYIDRIEEELGLDLTNAEQGQELAQKVAVALISDCQKVMDLTTMTAEARKEAPTVIRTLRGTLVRVEKDQFASIIVKDANTGAENRLLWLKMFPGAEKVGELVGKGVEISYSESLFYVPEKDAYQTFKVMYSLN